MGQFWARNEANKRNKCYYFCSGFGIKIGLSNDYKAQIIKLSYKSRSKPLKAV